MGRRAALAVLLAPQLLARRLSGQPASRALSPLSRSAESAYVWPSAIGGGMERLGGRCSALPAWCRDCFGLLPAASGGGGGTRRLSFNLAAGDVEKARTETLNGREVVIPKGYASVADAHRTLSVAETRGRRIIIVGDVHGCADELEDMLREVSFDRASDICIFAGDLVAKGPDSVRVVQIARDIGALAVLGNHDYYTVNRRADDKRPEGEHSVLARSKLSDADLDWMDDLPLTLRIEEHGIVVVHAGLIPGLPREETPKLDLLHMRLLTPEGKPTSDDRVGSPWVDSWRGPDHVVFGHDAARGLQQTDHATGLDCGCVYGGSLAALLVPSKEVVKVKARKVHLEPSK